MADFVAIFVIALALAGWFHVGWSWLNRKPVLMPPPRHTIVPWGLMDLILIVAVLVSTSTLIAVVAVALGWISGGMLGEDTVITSPDQVAWQMAFFAATSAMVCIAGLLWIRWRHKASLSEQGLARPSIRDLQLGLIAGATLLVPTYLIQAIVTQFIPSSHPLTDLLQENPSPQFFAIAAFVAVVVAPITEELFFRVWLQGWLENIAVYKSLQRQAGAAGQLPNDVLVMGRGSRPVVPVAAQVDDNPMGADDAATDIVADTAADTGADVEVVADDPDRDIQPGSEMSQPLEPLGDPNPYRTPADARDSSEPSSAAAAVDGSSAGAVSASVPATRRPPQWTIVVSSLLFAAAHLGNGSDPIPLFFFALGLGYIYQRTRNVFPCILVHAMCNGIAIYALWLFSRQ